MKRNGGGVLSRIMIMGAFIVVGGGACISATAGIQAFYRWIQYAPELAVAAIEIEDNHLIPSEEMIALSGLSTGENLFGLDLQAAGLRLKQDPRIKAVFLRKHWPDRIHIQVTERKPLALLHLDRLYGVDADGAFIPLSMTQQLPDLPVITGLTPEVLTRVLPVRKTATENQSPYETVQQNPMLGRAIDVLEQLNALSPDLLNQISEVHVENPEDPILYTVRDGIAIRIGIGRYSTKLRRLKLMFERLKRDGISTASIDLRFENQVIIRPIVTGIPSNKQS